MNFKQFKTPPCDLELMPGEVHVWSASLDQSGSCQEMLYETLSQDERDRAKRFVFEKDRRRFAICRGILRTILAFYLGIDSSALLFCYGKNGKPALIDTSGKNSINFNISRTGGLALFAFTRGFEIGVDIEQIRDIPEMEQVAKRFFTEEENGVFRSLPENKKKMAFFNCWTRKEAFIKAVGEGLSYPLDRFSVSLVPDEPARLLKIIGDTRGTSKWSIEDLKPASGFAAALAVEGHNWQLSCRKWLS